MLKQDPYYLEKVLPTAFAFGIQSEILEKITPEVLQSYGIHEQGFDYFVDHFSLFNTYLATPVVSSSSHSGYSSSGGFSSGSSF